MQAAPNTIYVREAASGMPEWVKILISAATGALFGIGGSVVMEFVKPAITKRRMRKIVIAQLAAELLDNMRYIDGAIRILKEADNRIPPKRDAVISMAAMLLKLIDSDRFDHFFTNEKMLVYEVDDDKSLTDCYDAIKNTAPACIERLCDLGASELLMPLSDFQRATATTGYTLSAVSALMESFGSSFEATAFRLASAHPGIATAGLLRYRLRVGEQRQRKAVTQTLLFSSSATNIDGEEAEPKYRRQSLHLSEACSDAYAIRWNKSFPAESVVYSAATNGDIQVGFEGLPNQVTRKGRLEAVRAPYQRDDADPVFGDVLFFWSA